MTWRCHSNSVSVSSAGYRSCLPGYSRFILAAVFYLQVTQISLRPSIDVTTRSDSVAKLGYELGKVVANPALHRALAERVQPYSCQRSWNPRLRPVRAQGSTDPHIFRFGSKANLSPCMPRRRRIDGLRKSQALWQLRLNYA